MASDLLRALIYGDSGVGKTRLSVSVCNYKEFWPVVVLNCYGGQGSYKDFLAAGMPQPYVVEISTFKQLQLAWQLIQDKTGNLRKQYGWDFTGLPRTVIIDQITDLQRFATTAIVRDEAGLNNEPGNILPKMEWPGYNRLQLSFLDNTNYFTNMAGIHTIAIAHEEVDNGVATVCLDGKSKQALIGRVSFVGRLAPVGRIHPAMVDQMVAARNGRPITNNVLTCFAGATFVGKNQYGKQQFFGDPDGSIFVELVGGTTEKVTKI